MRVKEVRVSLEEGVGGYFKLQLQPAPLVLESEHVLNDVLTFSSTAFLGDPFLLGFMFLSLGETVSGSWGGSTG